ncbi:hypothetical protein AAVH_07704, partial [Aphelenchoides avenae]
TTVAASTKVSVKTTKSLEPSGYGDNVAPAVPASAPVISPQEAVGYDGIPPPANAQASTDEQHDVVISGKDIVAKLPLKRVDSATTKRKWKPYMMDCSEETDERGEELCKEWAKGGLCEAHRATMFLFCRRTCLCVGPPEVAEDPEVLKRRRLRHTKRH